MKNSRRGFTLIEVAIFLVITGALFIAVTIGVQNSIYQQRQNDAVQNLAEFVRSVYSQTTNVESEGDGRSNKAIYGKLLTIGEEYNLAGNKNDANALFTYNVIGDIGGLGGNSILTSLADLNANVITSSGDSQTDYRPVGLAESYTPKWASAIQYADKYEKYKGAVLIVRHPRSGTVYTFAMEGKTVEVNKTIKTATSNGTVGANPLSQLLKDGSFKIMEVNLCLNTNGNENTGNRYDIRIVKNAANASGVEAIMGDDNKCMIGG